MRTLKHLLLLAIFAICNFGAKSQLYEEISISSPTIFRQSILDTIHVNADELQSLTWGIPPYTYQLFVLSDDLYTIIETKTVQNLSQLSSIKALYRAKNEGQLKLFIYDSLMSDYLYGIFDFIVQKPQLIIQDTILCENARTNLQVSHTFANDTNLNYKLLKYNTNYERWDTLFSQDSSKFNIYAPDLTDSELKDDLLLEYKCLITQGNKMQETKAFKIKVVNIGNPALSSYDYMCGTGSGYQLNIQSNGRNASNFSFLLFKYNSNIEDYEYLQNTTNSYFNLYEAGNYLVFVTTIDTVSACYKPTNSFELRTMPNELITQYDKFVLEGENDSVIIHITNFINDPEFPININWYFNDSLMQDEDKDYIVVRNTGIYHATIGNEICDVTSNRIEVTADMMFTSTDEQLHSVNKMKIYPNPAINKIRLQSDNSEYKNKKFDYKIFNKEYKLVQQGNFNFIQDYEILISDKIASGSYTLQIFDKSTLIQSEVLIINK
jgi:hypothetical protein